MTGQSQDVQTDVRPGSSTPRRMPALARRALSLTSAIAVASTVLVGVSTAALVGSAAGEEIAATPTPTPTPGTSGSQAADLSSTAVPERVLSGREQALARASRAGLAAGSFRSKAYGIAYAREWAAFAYRWDDPQITCLASLWQGESSWRWNAKNRRTGAYGIPQALPGTKMASEGADWKTNPETQIRWGLKYIASRHMTPCKALAVKKAKGWY